MSKIYYIGDLIAKEEAQKFRDLYNKDGECTEEILELYNEHKPENIKRGDLMILTDNEERNETAAIYDGDLFLDLASEPYDYGIIPKQFLMFDEFPLDHFRNTGLHNNVVPFDHNKHCQKIMDNLKKVGKYYTSEFKIGDHDVKLCYYPQRNEKDKFKLDEENIYYSYGEFAEDFTCEHELEKKFGKMVKAGFLFYGY